MSEKFQAVVIGGGPGGYVCAIRLSQLGIKTACIDSRGTLGGTCLNIGCIPSKNLLNLSENFEKAKKFSNLGIEVGQVKLNLDKIMQNKNKAVDTLTKGVEFLFKKNKVSYYKGTASFKSEKKISIKDLKKKIINYVDSNFKGNNNFKKIVEASAFCSEDNNIISDNYIINKDQKIGIIPPIGGG